MPQTAELVALCRRKAILTPACITVGLRDRVTDRLRRRLELLSQFLRRATGSNQLYHLPAEFRRFSCHCGTPKTPKLGCPRNRGNFNGSKSRGHAFDQLSTVLLAL
jgi:hypothetical protein